MSLPESLPEFEIEADPRPRDEDLPLVTGKGRYTDDIVYDAQVHMAVVRSPVAAGRITSIETDDARAMPGVLGVFTGADVAADGLGSIRPKLKFDRPDGSPMFEPPFEMLTRDAVHCVGDPVAIVVAETALQAEDAAEAVFADIEDAPTVADVADAIRPDAPAVWSDVPDNIAFRLERGDREAVDAAMAGAHHVTELTLRISRVSAHPIEPRGVIGRYDADKDVYRLTGSIQAPFRVRDALTADILGIEGHRLEVESPDVGGSFGMKNGPYQEYALVLWAAKKLGRPVKWIGKRTECFVSDCDGRDNLTHVRLALADDGRFMALDVKTYANLGAYMNTSTPHPPTANLGGLAGVYRTPHIAAEVFGVHTHTHSTAPYRGAGRPEATYVIERVIDVAAQEMGIDRAELRRRNLIAPDQMPYKTGLVFTYDCGEFEAVLDEALAAADWDGFAARRAASEADGKLRGIGLSNPIEIAGGPLGKPNPEYGAVSIESDGRVTVKLGGHDTGMGHRTSFRSLARQVLGVRPEDVEIVTGHTGHVEKGTGSFGSRTLGAAGTSFYRAAQEVIGQAKERAAKQLGTTADGIDFDPESGVLRVRGTNRTMTLVEAAALGDGGLSADAWTSADNATFPNGCHVCEVEIDPETGNVSIEAYCVVDDVGTVLNPILVKGQIQGGVAQGLGQALMEEMVYDPSTAQLMSGSFQDYAMPRADDLSAIQVLSRPVPTAATPFGTKGVGEAGTVGSIPAVVNAVVDALSGFGVRHVDMPLTPEKVWRAIRSGDPG